MSIYTPEAATAFGALDYDALVDGKSLDANVARTMTRQANRLIRKRHQLLSLQWPVHQTDSEYRVEIVPSLGAGAVLAPFTIRKKPGITKADLYLRVRVPSGRKVRFGAATRAQPDALVGGAGGVLHTGSGSWEYITMEVPLDPGPVDELRLVASAESEGTLMDEATYGAPNSDTLEDYDLSINSIEKVAGGNPTWDEAAIAQAGHYIQFYGPSGAIRAFRIIDGSTNKDHLLYFDISRQSVFNVIYDFFGSVMLDGMSSIGAENSFEIRELGWFALANLVLIGQDRSIA